MALFGHTERDGDVCYAGINGLGSDAPRGPSLTPLGHSQGCESHVPSLFEPLLEG